MRGQHRVWPELSLVIHTTRVHTSDILISYTFTPLSEWFEIVIVPACDACAFESRICDWEVSTTEEYMSMPLAAARINCCCWRSSSLGQGSGSSSASWLSSPGSKWFSSSRSSWSPSDSLPPWLPFYLLVHLWYHSSPFELLVALSHASNHVSDSRPLLVIVSDDYPQCLRLVYHIPIVWQLLW